MGNNTSGGTLPQSIRGDSTDSTRVVEADEGRLIIDNPELLFLGDFERQGDDLSISYGGETNLVIGYFANGTPANLEALNGAYLTAQAVNSLTGDPTAGQYAQAGGGGEPLQIGKVVKLEGSASTTSVSGTKNELEVGSPVFQGDVVETGADSSLGISFVDETVFSMSSDARMILDELIYDPANVENSSMAFNLVQGAFVFVTGEIAPTGNMAIETPVATMGIRGTTPRVVVNTALGVTEFTILPDPGSENVGSYTIVNKATGAIMGSVTAVADKWVVTGAFSDAVKITKSGLDLLEDQLALDEITDIFNRAASDRAELDGSTNYTNVAIDLSGGDDGEAGDDLAGDDGGTDVSVGVEDTPNQDDPPIAFDDDLFTDDSSPITVNLNVITGNNGQGVDIDPEGFPIILTQINGRNLSFVDGEAKFILPSGAVIKVTNNGGITYFPNEAYKFLGLGNVDIDQFEYTIQDQGGQTDRGVISVSLTGRNQQPLVLNVGSRDLSDTVIEGDDTGNAAPSLIAAGQLVISDPDASDQHSSVVVSDSVSWEKSDGTTDTSLGEVGSVALDLQESMQDDSPNLVFDLIQTNPPQPGVYGPLVSRPEEIRGTVDWTWTGSEADIDFLGVGEILTLVYEVTVTDDSGVGGGSEPASVTQLITIVLVGTNDGPTISSIVNASPDRDENELGPTIGSFEVTDVDVTDVVSITDVRLVSAENDGNQETPDPADLLDMFSPRSGDTISSGATVGTVNWQFTPNGETFDYLADGESLELTYAITLDDGKGGTVTQDIVVTINGLNDDPFTSDETDVDDSLSEISSLKTAGSFEVTDLDTSDTVSISGVTVATSEDDSDSALPNNGVLLAMFTPQSGTIIDDGSTVGVVNWSFNANGSNFDYLSSTEQLVLTYTVTFEDNSAAGASQATQLVEITITGTNSDPIVTGSTIAVSPLIETNDPLITTGTISFADTDTSDVVSITQIDVTTAGDTAGLTATLPQLDAMFTPQTATAVAGGANTGTVNWTFDSSTLPTAFNYLAVGESLVLNYEVTFSDNGGSGALTHNVAVTINGTNDGPTITATNGELQTRAEGSTATTTGSFSVEDLDHTDVVTVSQVKLITDLNDADEATPDHAALLAMLNVNAGDPVIANGATTGTVNWIFDPDGFPAPGTPDPELFSYLADGEELELTYEVTVTDSNGGSDTQQIVITVVGGNNAPQAASDSDAFDEGDTLATSGSIIVTDLDTSDVVSFDPSGVTVAVDGTYAGVDPLTMFTPTSGDVIGDKSTSGTIEWSFNAGGQSFEYLASGQEVEFTYTLPLTDGNSGAAAPTVVITITGTDDDPFVSAETGSAQSQFGEPTTPALAGSFTISDVDTTDSVNIGEITDGAAAGTVTVTTSGPLNSGGEPTVDKLADLLSFGATPVGTDNPNTVNWTFEVPAVDNPFEYLGLGESLELTYSVPYSDSGVPTGTSDVHEIVITVHGTNSGPVIVEADSGPNVISATIDEDAALTAVGKFGVEDANITDVLTISEVRLITSGADGHEATPDHADLLAMFSTVNNTPTTNEINWNFNAVDPDAFDYLSGITEDLILTYTVVLEDGKGGRITEDVVITINGVNNVTTVDNRTNSGLALNETEGGLMTMGSFDVHDVDTSDIIAITGVSVDTAGTSAGVVYPPGTNITTLLEGMFSQQSSAVISNTANDGTVNWAFNAGHDAFDFLAAGQDLVATYTVTLTGGVTETVVITISGTNDLPFVSATGVVDATLSETSLLSSSGTFDVTDVDLPDVVSVDTITVTTSGDVGGTAPNGVPDGTALLAMFSTTSSTAVAAGTDTGTVAWDFDGTTTANAFEYLAAGESVVLTYHVPFSDADGGGSQDIVITVTGTNDLPFVSATGTVTDTLSESSPLLSTGTFDVTDVDTSDEVSVDAITVVPSGDLGGVPSNAALLAMFSTVSAIAVTDTQDVGTVTWNFDGTTTPGAFDYLAAGESLLLTYTVALDDGNGGTTSQNVTITVDGVNEGPALATTGNVVSAGLTEGGMLMANGVFGVTDSDTSNTVQTLNSGADLVTVSAVGDIGTLTNADLLNMFTPEIGTIVDGTSNSGTASWSFNAGDETFGYLSDGETLVVTYSIPVEDSTGASFMQSVDITITGVNNAPSVIANPLFASAFDGLAAQDTGGAGNPYVTQLLTNDGANNFVVTQPGTPAVRASDIALGDFDNDGDLDAFTGVYFGDGQLMINQGGAQGGVEGVFNTSTFVQGSLNSLGGFDPTYTLDVEIGDVTGDGFVDILIANWNGQANQLLTNDGAGGFAVSVLPGGSLSTRDIRLGDIDADGDLDAILTTDNGTNQLLTNLGGTQGGTEGTFAASFLPSAVNQLASLSVGIDIGDVNGDGHLDVLIASTLDQNELLLGNGAGGFTTGVLAGGNRDSTSIRLGDLDGDGDLDAFVTNIDGQANQVLINQGGTQGGTLGTFVASDVAGGNQNSSAVTLVDVDQDGDLDAIVSNNDYSPIVDQTNKLLINDGTGVFTAITLPDGNMPTNNIAIGDLDGDGTVAAVNADGLPNLYSGLNVGILVPELAATLTETGAGLSTSGSFLVSDGDAGETISLTAGLAVSESGTTAGLGLNNAQLLALFSPAIAANQVDWTFDSSAQGNAFDYLNSGESLVLTYTVPFQDNSGSATAAGAQDVVITINGINDVIAYAAPDASPTTGQFVIEAGDDDAGTPTLGTPAAAGGTFATANPADPATVVWTQTSATDTYGSFTLDAAGNWGYSIDNALGVTEALSENQVETETLEGSVTYNEVKTTSFSIAVTETNLGDILIEPVDEFPAVDLAFDGVFTHLTESESAGTITVIGTNGTLELTVATGAWTFTPFGGAPASYSENFDFDYAYTSTTTHTEPVSQTVDVHGTNDGPEIVLGPTDTVISGSVTEDAGTPTTVSGGLSATDDDSDASLVWTVDNGFGAFGNLVVNDTNDGWTYTLDDSNPIVNGLAAGDPALTDTFNLRVTDNHGATQTQVVTITINGADDQPVFNVAASDLSGTVVEQDENIVATPVFGGIAGLTVDPTSDFSLANAQIETGTSSDATDNVVNGPVGSLLAYTATGLTSGEGSAPGHPGFGGTDYDLFNLNDGDANSAGGDGFHAIPNAGANSLVLDLGSEQTIYSIAIYNGYTNRDDGTYTLKDGDGNILGNWTISGTPLPGAPNNPVHSFWLTFDQPVTTDTLVFDTTTTDFDGGQHTNSYREIEIYGVPPLTESGEIAFNDVDTDVALLTVGTITASVGALGVLEATIDAPDSEIDWSYSVQLEDIQYLAHGETKVETFEIPLFDGTNTVTETVTITLKGTNDDPFVSSTGVISGILGEDSSLAAAGSFQVTDVDLLDTVSTGAVTVAATGVTDGMPAATQTALASMMMPVTGTSVIDGSTTVGTVNWSFDGSGSSFDYLANGESLILTYTIPFTDGMGGDGSQEVVITITGADDATSVTNTATPLNLDETEGALGPFAGSFTVDDDDVSGLVIISDVNVTTTGSTATALPADILTILDGMFTATPETVIDGTSVMGTVNWTFDAGTDAFDFLGVGEVLTANFTVQMIGATDQTIVVNITGTNEAPLVSMADNAGDLLTDEGRNLVETDSALTTSGSFEITDLDVTDTVDVGAVVVATTSGTTTGLPINTDLANMLVPTPTTDVVDGSSTTGTVDWTFTSGAADFDYLAAGQTVTIVYTIPFTDGNAAGSETVTITVKGTNDVPTITGVTGDEQTMVESATAVLEGTIGVSDVDITDAVSISDVQLVTTGNDGDPATPTPAILLGMFTPKTGIEVASGSTTGTIDWDFDPGSNNFDYLAPGEDLVLTYTIVLDDGNGGTVSEEVEITIQGGNNGPTVSVQTDVAETFTEAPDLQTTGSFVLSDLDTSDVVMVTGVTVAAVESNPVALNPATPLLADLDDMFVPQSATIVDGVSNTGTVFWSFNANGESFAYLADGESLVVTYSVAYQDDNLATGSQDVTITINGTNSLPVVTSDTNPTPVLTETDAGLMTSGVISFADVDTTDIVTVSTPVSFARGGDVAGIPVSDAQLTAMFSLASTSAITDTQTTGTVGWTFNSSTHPAAFDYLAVGESLELTYTVTFADDSGSGDQTHDVFITINGTNDGPEFTAVIGDDTPDFTEGPVPASASGSFVFTDADASDVVTITEVRVMTGLVDNDGATPNATALLGMLNAVTAVDNSGAEPVHTVDWTFTPGTTFEYLADGEMLTINYEIIIDDDNGGTASENVAVTIIGTNSAPIVSALTDVDETLSETSPLNTTGSFELTDVDTTDEVSIDSVDVVTSGDDGDLATPLPAALGPMFVTQLGTVIDGASNTGVVNWSFNANGETFDYLAVGETLTIDYTVNFSDNHSTPATGSQLVRIMITGTNDLPVITATTNATPTLIETNATLVTDGSIDFADADTSDEVTITNVAVVESGAIADLPPGLDLGAMFSLVSTDAVAVGANTGTVEWDFSSGAEVFNYLAVGESLVLTYTLTFSDGTVAGTFTEDVVITINGTNDGPTISNVSGDTFAMSEGTLAPVIGDFDVTDLDVSDVVSVREVLLETSELDGAQATPDTIDLIAMFTLVPGNAIEDTTTTGDVNWTFNPGSETFEYLSVGESLVLTYTIVLEDHNGATVSQNIEITINGSNNAPTITATTFVSDTMDETDGVLATSGSFDIQDVDTTDEVTVSDVEVLTDDITGLVPSDIDLLAMFSPDSGQLEIDGDNIDGTVFWAFNAGTEAFDYLGDGDSLELTYRLTIEDDNGEFTKQDVVLTINGTNDSAVIGGDLTGAAAEDSGIILTGRVTATDLDNPDNMFVADSGDATFGSYTIDVDGNWTYTLDDGNPLVDGLTLVSDAITDSFTVTSEDGTTETVEISITDDPLVGTPAGETIIGGLNDDIILGGAGGDTLFGAAGKDLLNGGEGNDFLQGGGGADIFQFTDLNLSLDEVVDFEYEVDSLDLDALLDAGMTATVSETESGGQVTGVSIFVEETPGSPTQIADVTFATSIDSATFDSEALFAANNGAVTS
ncbi:MAG: VCBS domain-containing protein [Rhizobiaceae bacterium]